MKKLLLSLIVITLSVFLYSQTPNQFKYQAVLRNADRTLMTEENVTIIVSILKSDLTTSVFNETHNTTTTVQGLINLNIGSLEDLSTVNWTLDEYFIEISVNGTIIGTSQLLSVPYALHAKTAERFISYSIGDYAYGGIVFYVDQSGQHGLVCAKKDISESMPWYIGTFFDVNARGRGIGSGEMNTALIIAGIVAKDEEFHNYAAEQCAGYTALDDDSNVIGGWHLPSSNELKLIYEHKDIINTTALEQGGESFKDNSYWSSTEANYLWAYFINFSNGYFFSDGKLIKMEVRPIRSF